MSISGLAMRLGPISAAGPGALYQQIVEAIKREVASGRLAAGTALPSFRVLAQDLLVSLITVKRAYEELERAGIIYRRQGLGTFVAERGHDRTRAVQRARALEALTAAVRAGREAGMSNRELQQELRQALARTPPQDDQTREAV
jgi:GntR family transcriptional regulator